MKIAVCQMPIVQGDREKNRKTAEQMLTEAAKCGANVIALPEMWTSGYDFQNLSLHEESLNGETALFLSAQAKKFGVWLIGGSHPVRYPDGVRNTSLTFDPNGTLQNTYSKIHLIGLMNEDKYLVPGDHFDVFSLGGESAAVEICYDVRFTELSRSYALMGAKILFIPAEFPVQREDHWVTLLRARAIENQMYVVGINAVGKNDNDTFKGKSMIIDPWGQTLAVGCDSREILTADVDLSNVSEIRQMIPVFKDRKPEYYKIDK
ncbi:carbon-nitrogen family hydrolase [Alicyclobacillus dauci]|uniref:Carbon-nitrogen family hydrolase n=1 Tax=Alicyclobacillus dauci TaxID=1475485 RepID=A0ABY6Z129_9BACL|nr:carbon-nitrogen family hydrolase [Alicyclobacillus dauci]WAH36526.1 carbon-nitrogen family hydrolase [Alicyclobacillus dauci]